jgi:dTDP-4-amino-4,6-dideoxygalactose transaminase
VAEQYNDSIDEGVPRLSFMHNSIFHHYVIFSSLRDKLRMELGKKGINTEIHYPNLAAIEMEPSNLVKYPMGSYFSSSGLSIPISPWQTKKNVKKIAFEINKSYKNL